MPERTNIRLDSQARRDALTIAQYYGLKNMADAIRFALREIARRIEDDRKT